MTIYTLSELQTEIAACPSRWRPLVFTNGCFDLLHVGHLRYLQAAKACGKSLGVGLNSDRAVAALKPTRPIIPQWQRVEIIAALKPVDAAIVFDSLTASETIIALQPDIYAKGGDYTLETLPEAPTVQSLGSKIKLISVEVKISTSQIIDKIRQSALA